MNEEQKKVDVLSYSHLLNPVNNDFTLCGVKVDSRIEIKESLCDVTCPDCNPKKETEIEEEPFVHWAALGSLCACGNNESGLSTNDIKDVTCPKCLEIYNAFDNKSAEKSEESMTILVIHIGFNAISKVVDNAIEGLIKSGVLSKLSI